MSLPAYKISSLADLRSLYHSLDTEERNRSILQLAQQKNSDSVRELIHVFNECEWRETKFQVIKALAIHPDLRCLEFLFEQAKQSTDLPLAEAAIESLGESKSAEASQFLISLYVNGHESLKPASALALGKLSNRKLLATFIDDLKLAYGKQQTLLVKSLVLTLGELKAQNAVADLVVIAKNKIYRDLSLSALVSLGKISKDINIFDSLEMYFKNDSFEYQIFQNAKGQCQFRSGWKLEDYLNKILTQDVYHQALYLEFNAYPAKDVKVVLDILKDESRYDLLFKVLAKLEHREAREWFIEYSQNMDSQYNFHFFSSISEQSYSVIDAKSLDNYFLSFDISNEVNADLYVKCYLNVDPKFEVGLNCLLKSKQFSDLESDKHIHLINSLYKYTLTLYPDQKKYLAVCKASENFFYGNNEKMNSNVLGRWIRFFSQIKHSSSKLNTYLLDKEKSDLKLNKSIWYYFEMNETDFYCQNFYKKTDLSSVEVLPILKIFLNSNQSPFLNKKLDQYFQDLKKDFKNIDHQVLLLKLIAKFKPNNFKDYVVDQCKSNDYLIQLNVILAIKSYSDEAMADSLSTFLTSQSKSISGRALDAMLTLPGNRAKRLVFEYLAHQLPELSFVEKIARSFVKPDNDTDYFYKKIEVIVKSYEQKNTDPQITQLLVNFRDELVAHYKSFSNAKLKPTEADILAIDLDIEKLIPSYVNFEESSKAAFRSAELPFRHPTLFDSFVDKSSIVLGYSKAIDIILEKQLGRKILFPRLESKINEFQNAVYSLTLNEDYPQGEKVLTLLKLEKYFTTHNFPVHKMSLIAKGILSSKIINEHFKILDGLRAWAVILLLFARANSVVTKPLIAVADDDALCVSLAKKLIWLQDIRNPIAHRQTVVEFKDLESVRAEVFEILKLINKVLF